MAPTIPTRIREGYLPQGYFLQSIYRRVPRLSDSPSRSAVDMTRTTILRPSHRFQPSIDSFNSAAHRPFGIYVHVPFCLVRCGYCSFVTAPKADLPSDAFETYQRRVVEEIDAYAARLPTDVEVATIYFGGGTPTMLSSAELRSIVNAIRSATNLATRAEITVEANPETVSEAYLDELLEAGFNRISLGLQSTDQTVLKMLDRPHEPTRALHIARASLDAGFSSVSLDLMAGTPGESDDVFLRSLDDAIETGAHHISMYLLSIESGTPLQRSIEAGAVSEPNDDDAARRYVLADQALSAAGFGWYEISNWAKGAAHHCAHNLLYWNNDHWIGLGPGAHSHVGRERWWNTSNIDRYLGGFTVQGGEELNEQEQALENLMLSLRRSTGFAMTALPGDKHDAARAVIERLRDRGLIESVANQPEGAEQIALTRDGRLLANDVISEIYLATQ